MEHEEIFIQKPFTLRIHTKENLKGFLLRVERTEFYETSIEKLESEIVGLMKSLAAILKIVRGNAND